MHHGEGGRLYFLGHAVVRTSVMSLVRVVCVELYGSGWPIVCAVLPQFFVVLGVNRDQCVPSFYDVSFEGREPI